MTVSEYLACGRLTLSAIPWGYRARAIWSAAA